MYLKRDLAITGTSTSESIAMMHEKSPFNVSVMVSIPSSTTGNISLEYTGKLDFSNATDKDYKVHTDMNNIDLSTVQNQMIFVNLLSPCSAIRFKTTAASQTLTINVLQSGSIAGIGNLDDG